MGDFNNQSFDDELYAAYEEDEDEVEVDERLDESGIVDLIDDEEDERRKREEMFYQGFPNLDDIYREKKIKDYVPSNLSKKQKEIFNKGINEFNKINKKYGCNLSFNEFVDTLNQYYEDHQTENRFKRPMAERMSFDLWHEASYYARKMEEMRAYTIFSEKEIAANLEENFEEVSKVLGLYVKLYPEKFPAEERERNFIFDSKGKLRSTFKSQHNAHKIDFLESAERLADKAENTAKIYYRQFSNPEDSKNFILGKLNEILNRQEENPQIDRVTKLAECVRLLRPLQAKRERRSVLQYFTNKKVYVSERDTLRQCKEEMKRLGLSKKEISKVLHGGSFNDVIFNDGVSVREQLSKPIVNEQEENKNIIENISTENKKVGIVVHDAVIEHEVVVDNIHEEKQEVNDKNLVK